MVHLKKQRTFFSFRNPTRSSLFPTSGKGGSISPPLGPCLMTVCRDLRHVNSDAVWTKKSCNGGESDVFNLIGSMLNYHPYLFDDRRGLHVKRGLGGGRANRRAGARAGWVASL
jgi:hypothetical protein